MDYEKKYKESMTKMSTFLAKHDGFTISKDGEMYKELSEIFPELAESEDERIKKAIRNHIVGYDPNNEILIKEEGISEKQMLAWLEKQGEEKVYSVWVGGSEINDYYLTEKEAEKLAREYKEDGYDDVIIEKQGEQKPTKEIEPFEAEHGKYYYCIKDYFCGGRKQASKGDVVQALRGLPIMGLKDASEYFLPVNLINNNSTWSEEDELNLKRAVCICSQIGYAAVEDWLKSLKNRVQQHWKPTEE